MILVIGDSNVDAAARVPRFPREGDDVPLSAFTWSSGGAGVNVATGVARLGGRARLVSRVGADGEAGTALAACSRAGVDLSAVQRDPALATGACVVMVSPGGERTFLSFRGANAALESAPADAWSGVRRLHVCGHALLAPSAAAVRATIDEALRREIPASLDLCLPLLEQPPSALADLWPVLDAVFANEPEIRAFASATGLPRPPSRTVIVKRGARGATVLGATDVDVAPFAVDAIDSTAAGDAFVAAYLVATLSGRDAPSAARLACAAGAFTAARAGSADILPSLLDLRAFLAERGALTGPLTPLFPPTDTA